MALAGVYATQLKNGTASYRAGITLKNKHISLGSFATETAAHEAYCYAHALFASDSTIEDYSVDCPLDFSKYVSLVNLRDNGIYIKTPIYLGKKFFSYYVSEDLILTFDTDDLFFYSTHTIMQRGGHLFVADYGMQINILSRYGIREHAVMGRDYLFVNGNPYDLRYGNIRIINRYFGVTRFTKKNKEYFKTKIHIRGDFVVGIYDTEEKAAIAYNKAADILKRNGCTKQFPENYPEGISNRDYATIYQELVISDKILSYR